MTHEDKQLLLKDLCMRLPYGVICRLAEPPFGEIIEPLKIGGLRNAFEEKWDVKPYLRQMSSMTEKERKEYELLANRCISTSVGFIHFEIQELIDWLLKNHFDFQGLIDKGFAIEVTEQNNPYKEKEE